MDDHKRASAAEVPLTPERYQRLQDLVEQVAERSPAERRQLLAAACGPDAALLAEALALLDAQEALESADRPVAPRPIVGGGVSPRGSLGSAVRPTGSFIGRYRLGRLIGKGGMGEVYEAFDTKLERLVALKTISPEGEGPLMLEPFKRQRLQQEARILAGLRHEGIVTVHDLNETEGVIFVAMEYLLGESLQTVIAADRLSFADKCHILIQILDAVSYAHRKGVIHRDIKPSNVQLLPDLSTKLLDFGIARVISADVRTLSGAIIGTPYYMAPEQLKAEGADERTDVYSTGALAYELFTKRKPFDGRTVTEVMIKVICADPPPMDTGVAVPFGPLEAIIRQALAKSPADRFASAEAMADSVRVFMASEARSNSPARSLSPAESQVSATLPSAPLDPEKARRSLRWVSIAAVAVVVVLILLTGAAYSKKLFSAQRNSAGRQDGSLLGLGQTVSTATGSSQVPRKAAYSDNNRAVQQASNGHSSKSSAQGERQEGRTPTAASLRFDISPGATDELSRDLARRVADALRERRTARAGPVRVLLQMTTRPAPFGGTSAITADYVATVSGFGGAKTFEGHVLGFSRPTLTNDVLDRAGQEIIVYLTSQQ